jgi:Type II secretion system (T2SS), protein G
MRRNLIRMLILFDSYAGCLIIFLMMLILIQSQFSDPSDIKDQLRITYNHIQAITIGLSTFQVDYNAFPYSENIKELINPKRLFMRGHYLIDKYYSKPEDVIKDGWGNEMVFEGDPNSVFENASLKMPEKFTHDFKLISKGEDGKLGTADDIVWTKDIVMIPGKYQKALDEIGQEESDQKESKE